jgi:predicted ester cyclase
MENQIKELILRELKVDITENCRKREIIEARAKEHWMLMHCMTNEVFELHKKNNTMLHSRYKMYLAICDLKYEIRKVMSRPFRLIAWIFRLLK